MKIQNIDGQDYRLPNELSDFKLKLYVHLINWKWAHDIKAPGHSEHNREILPYDAILPDDYVAEKKMPHIYAPSVKHLLAHHERNPFRYHPHFYHMSSSQAANINLFLPILHHPNASAVLAGIKGAPKDFGKLATDQLDEGYCLEFWGGNLANAKGDKGPLEDKSSKAGTDSDIAIAYRNKSDELCLWLIEHKLTEEEFSTCGGFKSNGREACHDCARNFGQIIDDKSSCYQHAVRHFKYWEITEANRAFFANPPTEAGCPFQGGMNQLWRNQLLGLAMENDGKQFKHAHFSVVRHPENIALDASLADYQKLIANNPKFSTFTSADVIQAATMHGDADIERWAKWYEQLYIRAGGHHD